jgi:hypothetical protein
MKYLIAIFALHMLVPSLASARSLKEAQDNLDMQLGYQTMKSYCPAQAKTEVSNLLADLDLESCGLQPAGVVDRAVQVLQVEKNNSRPAMYYDFLKVSKKSKCTRDSKTLKSLVQKVVANSKTWCLRLGNTIAGETTVFYEYTSDGYCVVSATTVPAQNSETPDISKLQAAKLNLQNALNLYRSVPCNNQIIKEHITAATSLIQSTTLFEDPSDEMNQMRLCPFIENAP